MAFDIQFKLIYQGIRDVFRVRSLSQILFPQLDCVIEAAINGVTEAQVAMYKLYSEFLPRNLARKEYWKKKAELRDFPKLLRNVFVTEDFM